MKTVEILSVGTELLLGDIVNTDAAYIARQLAVLGFPLYRQTVVGDNPGRLRAAIDEAFSRADILILTGGLGPTCDDITKEVTAEALGLPLIEHAPSLAAMEEYLRLVGAPLTENNRKQALIPAGSTVFPNRCGTAPGMASVSGGRTAILLPGPPSELVPMFEESVIPYLSRFSDGVLYSLNLHLAGIGESAAEARLRDIMDSSSNPTVAPYAGEHEVRIRLTARAATRDEAERMCRAVKETVLDRSLREYFYAETDDPSAAADAPAHALLAALRERGMTFSSAESCTGGQIGARITAVPGASEVYVGSVISYSNSVKRGLLGVREETLAAHGAVSEETAREMALGARRATGADLAVSVTGIAGPGGGTAEKPVGTVCFGVADADGVVTQTMHFSPRGTRERIRLQAASHAMRMALKRLKEQK